MLSFVSKFSLHWRLQPLGALCPTTKATCFIWFPNQTQKLVFQNRKTTHSAYIFSLIPYILAYTRKPLKSLNKPLNFRGRRKTYREDETKPTQPSSLNSTMFGGNYGYIPNNGWPVIGNCSATQSAWTWEEDKVFERAILDFGEERPDRWHRIADWIPRKSPEEVRAHYEALVHDVFAIDSGLVEPPSYSDDSSSESSEIPSWAASRSEKKKKGNSWTPEEHRLFVCGLETYGKSDWRSISRNMVKTKTSAQVASHAQKYFLRHKSLEKKRPSIHDITTTVNTCPIPSPAQFPNQGCSMGHQDFNHSM